MSTTIKIQRVEEMSAFKFYYDQLSPMEKKELKKEMGIRSYDTLYKFFRGPMTMSMNQGTVAIQFLSSRLEDETELSLEDLCQRVRITPVVLPKQ